MAALAFGYLGGGVKGAGAQGTTAVAVGDFFFCDPSLPPGACQTVVSADDTVVWEYSTGSEGHTVTHCGDSCDTPTPSPLWDSGGLNPGQSFSQTFSAPGTYRYYCRFHPDAMRATVLVEAAPAGTATQPVPSPAASPSGVASPSSTVSPATEQGDGGGVALWVLILAGIAGGVILLGGGAFALRRFR